MSESIPEVTSIGSDGCCTTQLAVMLSPLMAWTARPVSVSQITTAPSSEPLITNSDLGPKKAACLNYLNREG